MQLISPEELTAVTTPLHKAAQYVRDFYQHRQESYIANVATKLALLNTGDDYFPVSINTGCENTRSNEQNSYVVSPFTAYIDYAKLELSALKKPLITWPISVLITLIGVALRFAQINKLIQINNWLLSTNIYSDIFSCYKDKKIESLRDFFTDKYPGFALGFRSLNEASNLTEIEALRGAGFVSVPSRQLYLFDGRTGTDAVFWKRHNTQIDAKSLAKMRYELSRGSEFSTQDFQRCEQLYRSLYIDKYCSLNPQYSSLWLATGQQNGWLNLIGLRNPTGLLEGVVGFFENDQIITAPIVGYNTSLPAKEALYRRLTQICLQRAITHKKLLNFSSGAAEFKRLRGGVPAIEYTMVYVDHLHFYRRWCWKLLGFLLRKIAVPLMKRWQL